MLTHLDESGMPMMVDVGEKKETKRVAQARTRVSLPEEVLVHVSKGEVMTKKGPVFQTAIIAGTMAAKKTSELIPFCHPLSIESCKISIELLNNEAIIDCTVRVSAKTGVEMEALTGASVAALTIYDMCKALSHHIEIKETKLIKKTGGKSIYDASSV